MPRWPANHKKRTDRNYAKESAWESSPRQKKRRANRTKVRYDAMKKGLVHKGDNKELDHVGYHPTGTLSGVRARVVSRTANRKRQPPHKGRYS
jgi:hypothetical protein